MTTFGRDGVLFRDVSRDKAFGPEKTFDVKEKRMRPQSHARLEGVF
jgi:hypothetical protein